MNYGFIEPELQEEDFILGGNQVPKENLQPNGQWTDFLPTPEMQSKRGHDTNNCTAFGTNSALEIYFKRKFFHDLNFSDRYLGIMAGTRPPGNDPGKVMEVLRTKAGCIAEEFMPFIEGMTVEEYYVPSPPTPDTREAGKNWLKKYYLRHEWAVTPESQKELVPIFLKESLKHSPIPISVSGWQQVGDKYVRFGQDNHWTVLVGYVEDSHWLVFDSYPNENGAYLKKLDWDFTFRWAKRIYVGVQDEPIQKEGGVIYYAELIQLAFIKLVEFFTKKQDWEDNQKLEPEIVVINTLTVTPTPTITSSKNPTVRDWALATQQHEGYFFGSRSFRNHNPGNLKASGFVKDVLKCTGVDKDNFAKWDSYDSGFNALVKFLTFAIEDQLRSYDPSMTIYQFYSVYAPSSDNNNPLQYAKAVAKHCNISVNDKISIFTI